MPEQGRGGRPVAASQRPTGGDKAIATKKQYFRRKKMCRFCVEKIDDINYKDVRLLSSFISERRCSWQLRQSKTAKRAGFGWQLLQLDQVPR